jgi:rRNA-processing protein FCF1
VPSRRRKGKARSARKAKPPRAAKKPAPKAPPKLVLEESAAQFMPEPAPPPSPNLQVVSPDELIAKLPPPQEGRVPTRFIILDTNALMMQFQFSVDIENEMRRIIDVPYEIIVPDLVMAELRNLARSMTGKDRGEVVMAIRLAETFPVVRSEGTQDTGILRLAEKLNAIVVTNDKILRARLRAKNIPNIHLRSKAFLTVEGHIGF